MIKNICFISHQNVLWKFWIIEKRVFILKVKKMILPLSQFTKLTFHFSPSHKKQHISFIWSQITFKVPIYP